MTGLFFNDLTQAIGISLLHSLWQGLCGVLLVLLITHFVNPRYSTLRYWLYTGVLSLVFMANLLTLFLQQSQLLAQPLGSIIGSTINANPPLTSFSLSGPGFIMSENMTTILPYFMMLWYAGVILLFIRMAFNLWHTRRVLTVGQIPVSERYQELFEEVITKLGIKRIVKIAHSNKVDTPSVIGHLKPVILLPIGLISGFSLEQVESILLHELSHIKRHDYLINLLQSTLEIIYFFNPFILIISRIIKDEREHASDDTAVSFGISPSVYANTLASVFNYAVNKQSYTMNFLGQNKLTLKRIQRIMKSRKSNNKGNRLLTILIFILAITVTMFYGGKYTSIDHGKDGLVAHRVLSASVFPDVDNGHLPTMELLTMKPLDLAPQSNEVRVPADTLDPKKKRKVEDYEQAIEKLKSTKEYKELQHLNEELAEAQLESLKSLEPLMEEVMRATEASLAFDYEELNSAMRELASVTEMIAIPDIAEELERVYEIETRAIEEAMRSIEFEMENFDLAEIEALTETLAVEAAAIALDAEKVAFEVEKYTEHIEDFFDEIKPLLVKDGYLKSSSDLDSFKYKKEGIWVNGDEIKRKDLNKYVKIHDKYFDEDDDFFMN